MIRCLLCHATEGLQIYEYAREVDAKGAIGIGAILYICDKCTKDQDYIIDIKVRKKDDKLDEMKLG